MISDQFKTQGFEVIPNFLTEEEIQLALAEYNKSGPTNNKNYELPPCTKALVKCLKPKIQAVAESVGNIDLWINGFFTNTETINWGWHQDHEPYYILQQTQNYINMYIPLVKPDPNLSGLCIIPLDKLDLSEIGASRYEPNETGTTVYNDTTDNTFKISDNIEDIKVTPTLNAGDLLLIRGGVIHRTQDNLTTRIALSLRCTDSTKMISKHRMLTGGELKKNIMFSDQHTYNKIIERFNHKDFISAGDLFKGDGEWLTAIK
jgi:hypothetical protein